MRGETIEKALEIVPGGCEIRSFSRFQEKPLSGWNGVVMSILSPALKCGAIPKPAFYTAPKEVRSTASSPEKSPGIGSNTLLYISDRREYTTPPSDKGINRIPGN